MLQHWSQLVLICPPTSEDIKHHFTTTPEGEKFNTAIQDMVHVCEVKIIVKKKKGGGGEESCLLLLEIWSACLTVNCTWWTCVCAGSLRGDQDEIVSTCFYISVKGDRICKVQSKVTTCVRLSQHAHNISVKGDRICKVQSKVTAYVRLSQHAHNTSFKGDRICKVQSKVTAYVRLSQHTHIRQR